MHLGKRWQSLSVEHVFVSGEQIIAVDGLQTNVVEEHSRAVGVEISRLSIGEKRREIVPGQSFHCRSPLRFGKARHSDEGG